MFLNISGVSINILVISCIFCIATAGHDHEIKGNGHQKWHTDMIDKRFPQFCADTEIKALAGPHWDPAARPLCLFFHQKHKDRNINKSK